MKKIVFAIFILSFLILNSSFSIVAQESTGSAIPEEAVKKSVKERLEKVASKDGDVLGNSDKKAYVGTLESLTQNALTIKTTTGSKQVAIAETAKIIGNNRQAVKVDDLEIGSYLIIMGYITDKDVLDGRRIVVSDKPLASEYKPFQTKVTKIAKNIITTAAGELKLGKNATITQAFSGNQTEIEMTDLKVEDEIILLGKPDAKKATILETVAIHLPKGRAIIAKPESAESTPSAGKTSPSPKASPTE